MSRPRTPTSELEKRGAFVKNPNRTRADPETLGPLGEPPDALPEIYHPLWRELSSIAPLDVLRVSDAWLVETAVRLMYRQRNDNEDMPFTGVHLSQLTWCLAHMGMTPSDRSKVNAPARKPEADPTDQYFN